MKVMKRRVKDGSARSDQPIGKVLDVVETKYVYPDSNVRTEVFVLSDGTTEYPHNLFVVSA